MTRLGVLFLLALLSGCAPAPPDGGQIGLGVDRSKAVRAETQKRVDDLNKTLAEK